jgi:hypothetical protein
MDNLQVSDEMLKRREQKNVKTNALRWGEQNAGGL